MRLQKNKCGLVSDGKWPPASDPNKADTSERTQRSAESSIFFSGSCELGVNARSGGEHCKIHGFTHLPFKFVAADSKQININVAQKRFLVWHTVPHRTYGMITAALKPERKQTRFRHRPGHCCPLKTQQESRLIWVQKGRVTHRLLKNDVEVKSPNRMPPYKSPSPATPGGLQGPQTTGRGIYAWGNSQSLLASETSGKDRHGICLGIGLLDMSSCKLAREISPKVPSNSTSSNNNGLRRLICNLCINIPAASGSAARGRMCFNHRRSRLSIETKLMSLHLHQTRPHFWSQSLLIQWDVSRLLHVKTHTGTVYIWDV